MNGWVSEWLIIEQRYFYSKRKEGRKDAAKKAHGKKQYGTSVYNVIVVSQ